MQAAQAGRAVAAARSTALALDLAVDDVVVLNDSNRLVLRLTPCDMVARVAHMTHHAGSAVREVELVQRLEQTDSPVATLDARVEPRVFVRDGFEIAMWTYFEPVRRVLPPAEYAYALARLHVGLRKVDVKMPHFMDRIAETQRDVASREITPDLTEADRALLAHTLRDLGASIMDRHAPEQLLHGEPHPWNVIDSDNGPLFIDFENTTQGPVEYDIAWVPDAVSDRYPKADKDLVNECRGLVLAIIAMHRWRVGDQHPSGGRRSGVAFIDAVRAGPPWPALDSVHW